ncbi:hypothetical protein LJC35_03455 [Parabacteroides sp. OttesenSCG-928-N08]|nr:hypothetical protein [Parabacteroides sp. OttesenSCG-928-N08]
MKRDEGDVFQDFRDSFSKLEGHFHVLEQRVPVELQMAYFKRSELMRRELPHHSLTDEESESCYAELLQEDVMVDQKMRLLIRLAISRSIKAYRLLQEYTQSPDPAVANWSYMALMELRISLESEMSDEKQIFISTGLGGKEEKLRFYLLLLSMNNKPLEPYQRKTIEREFAYYLPKADGEIERIFIGEQYVEIVFLIPVKTDIKAVIDEIITECNQYGGFLSANFTITNVRELSQKDIDELIAKNGDSKTGD